MTQTRWHIKLTITTTNRREIKQNSKTSYSYYMKVAWKLVMYPLLRLRSQLNEFHQLFIELWKIVINVIKIVFPFLMLFCSVTLLFPHKGRGSNFLLLSLSGFWWFSYNPWSPVTVRVQAFWMQVRQMTQLLPWSFRQLLSGLFLLQVPCFEKPKAQGDIK